MQNIMTSDSVKKNQLIRAQKPLFFTKFNVGNSK